MALPHMESGDVEGAVLPRRSFPCCRAEAEEQIGCKFSDVSYLEIGSDDIPLFQYTQQYISRLLSGDGKGPPSFSSARPAKQRARLDEADDLGHVLVYGKGLGKKSGRKRKRDDRSRWPKAPNIGLGWHRFEFKPAPVEDEEDISAPGPEAERGMDENQPSQSDSTTNAQPGNSNSSSGNGGMVAEASASAGAVQGGSEAGAGSGGTDVAMSSVQNANGGDKAQGPTTTIWALLQTLGAPVKNEMGPSSMYSTMVLFTRGAGRTSILWELVQQAARAATKVQSNVVSIWRYDMKHLYWQQLARRQPRLLKSVIMDKVQKNRLVEDLTWFMRDDTSDFYAKHGIPYHRSYLFYGPPGAGKTSCIFALAGHFKRNICFIQFNKGTTDDSFRLAVSDAPAESIVVMEDVDALFNVHRETSENSSLSFSGFLNALDGLGAPEDVIFILTTNHPERLDPAVRRPGRIDLHVAFGSPSREMAAEYFGVFYPGAAAAHAKEFAAATGERLRGGDLSMAQLQHFFLECHRRGLDAQGASDLVRSYNFDSGRHGSAATNMSAYA